MHKWSYFKDYLHRRAWLVLGQRMTLITVMRYVCRRIMAKCHCWVPVNLLLSFRVTNDRSNCYQYVQAQPLNLVTLTFGLDSGATFNSADFAYKHFYSAPDTFHTYSSLPTSSLCWFEKWLWQLIEQPLSYSLRMWAFLLLTWLSRVFTLILWGYRSGHDANKHQFKAWLRTAKILALYQ